MRKLDFDKSHVDKYTSHVYEFGYKALVITSMLQGTYDTHFGRVIQVRKKLGAFGTDIVLLRESDGNLHAYHNTGFYSIKKEYLHLYEDAMKEVDDINIDNIEATYYLNGNTNPAVGFIVDGLDDTNGKIYSFAISIEK